MTLGLRPAPDMSDAEVRRWLDGRDDWQDERWQDHCGDPGCDQCDGYIDGPGGSGLAAAVRRKWEGIG